MYRKCETRYAVVGKREDLNKIKRVLAPLSSWWEWYWNKKDLDADEMNMWEGSVIKLLGGDPFKKEWNMRGWVCPWCKIDGETLYFNTIEELEDTEKAKKATYFRFALSELLDVKIYYMIMEPEIFVTNDREGKYFKCRYVRFPIMGTIPAFLDDNKEELAWYEEVDPGGRLVDVELIKE